MQVNLLIVGDLLVTKQARAPFVLKCLISGDEYQLGLTQEQLGRLHELCQKAMDRQPGPGEQAVAKAT